MLKLAKELDLPITAITQTFAMLGKRGGGKTYAATKLAELMLEAGAQILALDPVGVWYGLRVPKSDKSKAFDIVVFGGFNGDIEINPKAGKIIAEIIIERNLSAVVDISHFVQSEQTRFAYDFLTTVFELKKKAPSAVHIFLEEAQEIVPQNIIKGDSFAARMLNAGERLVKLGRNFGIGCSLISQRPQEVNKKVLNQTEVMLAFQMTGLQERKTVAEWTQDKGAAREEMVSNLPTLETGEALAWSPSWLKFDGKVKILPKITADVSATPQLGDIERQTGKLAPVDVEELREMIESLTAEKEAENPKALKKRIAELEKQLSEKPKDVIQKQEIVFPTKEFEELQKLISETMFWANTFRDEFLQKFDDELETKFWKIANTVDELKLLLPKKPEPQEPTYSFRMTRINERKTPVAAKTASVKSESEVLPQGEKIILTAIAQNTDGASREQLTILTGYKKSSRDTYIQRLKQRGFITQEGSVLFITDDGFDALGDDFEPLPTGAELRQWWLNKLTGGEALIFQYLVDAYPSYIDRDKLSDLTGYKKSSRDTYIQRLAARKLIICGRGEVKAADNLF